MSKQSEDVTDRESHIADGRCTGGTEQTECTDKLCEGEAKYALWLGDSFSRVRGAHKSMPYDHGDLHPYICESCLSWYEQRHGEHGEFVRPVEKIVADGGTRQPTLQQSTKKGVYVDEEGELNEYGDAGAVHVDGVYSLEKTVELLAERLAPVKPDAPETVAEWERDDTIGYREETAIAWERRVDGGRETLELFPRGPRLHDWILSRTWWGDPEDSWTCSATPMDTSGYETPQEALDAAVTWMVAVAGIRTDGRSPFEDAMNPDPEIRADGGKCTSGTDRCPVCDEPLDGETTISSEGEVHEECAFHDPNVVVLPDGGTVEDDTERQAVELTGDVMYYCPSCEVLLGNEEAYEHTYSHRERGPNTGAVMDTFKEIPIAEPTTGPWKDDRSENTETERFECPNCGNEQTVETLEKWGGCELCGTEVRSVDTETSQDGGSR